MIPTWDEGTQLSQHLTRCQQYLQSHKSSVKLEISQSLKLDSSWCETPRQRTFIGKKKCIISENDSIFCAGCHTIVGANDCVQAISNPFSIARFMIVCRTCNNSLS